MKRGIRFELIEHLVDARVGSRGDPPVPIRQPWSLIPITEELRCVVDLVGQPRQGHRELGESRVEAADGTAELCPVAGRGLR